jgi:hypothetical protein
MTGKKRGGAKSPDTKRSPVATSDVPASSPPGAAAEAAPLKRNAKGQYVKGQSGNPAGPKPGTRQQLTKYKEEMEVSFREYMQHDARRTKLFRTWDRMLDIAENGEAKDAVAAFRAYAELVVSKLKPEEPAQNTGPGKLVLEIHNHTGGNEPPVGVVIDDVNYEEVTHG